jgi:hypothetical protein
MVLAISSDPTIVSEADLLERHHAATGHHADDYLRVSMLFFYEEDMPACHLEDQFITYTGSAPTNEEIERYYHDQGLFGFVIHG